MSLKNSLFGILFSLTLVTFAQTENTAAIDFVVNPYLQQVNDDSFHVLWETSHPGKGGVKLGVAEFNVLKPRLDRFFKEEVPGVFHRVIVNGLKVDGYYFYQAVTIGEKGDTIAGPVTPLHIPDYGQMPVSFAVVSDTQGNPKVWGRLANLIYGERPLFVIHAGDMVQYGPHKDDWTDEFFKPAAGLFRFCPLYPAIGNHEMNHDWFYQYLDLPGSEWFYTLKKGNALFVFVNTNKDILPGSEQYRELEQLLVSSSENWKIMVHHHPVYTSDEKGFGNTWFQRQHHGDPNHMHLKKLYETYGVDVVLNGHIHLYERTWPVAADKVDVENGVTYVTVGGGGGGLDPAGANRNWYTASVRSLHHFLSVNIVGNTFYAKAIDSSGVTFDSWKIEKGSGYKRLNAPLITETKQYFIDTTTVWIQNRNAGGDLFYQLADERIRKTVKKRAALPLKRSTSISTYVRHEGRQSRVAEKTFVQLPLFRAKGEATKRVVADYFEGDWIALPDFGKLKPKQTFDLDSVSLQNIQPRVTDHFAVRFTGSFMIPETDVYRFLLESYDGSKLLVDGQEIISNDGIHYEISKENFVALEKGNHTFEIQYFDYVRRETLNIRIGTQDRVMHWFNLYVNR